MLIYDGNRADQLLIKQHFLSRTDQQLPSMALGKQLAAL